MGNRSGLGLGSLAKLGWLKIQVIRKCGLLLRDRRATVKH